jgi:hypothetical protein
MNERIKELINQCTSYSDGSTWTSREEFDKEKFAELIVKECADIALKSGSVTNKSAVAVAEADRIYHKINEHFGVEE